MPPCYSARVDLDHLLQSVLGLHENGRYHVQFKVSPNRCMQQHALECMHKQGTEHRCAGSQDSSIPNALMSREELVGSKALEAFEAALDGIEGWLAEMQSCRKLGKGK